MPTALTNPTGTGQVAALIATGIDRLMEHELRSEPMWRKFADKRPVDVTGPTATVTLNFAAELAVVRTALTEASDPDPTALGNPTSVTVTLAEQGNYGVNTRKVELTSLSDIPIELADQMAFNQAQTLDEISQASFVGDATKIYRASGGTITALAANAGATDYAAAGAGCAAVAAGDVITSKLIRTAVTYLRAQSVMPRKGSLYCGVINPETSADLRAETGAAAWVDPHVYSDPGNIYNGEVGAHLGAYFIESPRNFNSTIGAASARVFNSYIFGKQFLAEAVGEEPHTVVGPVTDSLRRFRRVGWYGFIGWNTYRSKAIVQLATASTVTP